jgi:hypothetical protein
MLKVFENSTNDLTGTPEVGGNVLVSFLDLPLCVSQVE